MISECMLVIRFDSYLYSMCHLLFLIFIEISIQHAIYMHMISMVEDSLKTRIGKSEIIK